VTPGGALGAGRSTAIVLFTDVVGSTELRSRLGENAAEELRQGHDALVTGAVEASRGHVVKNLGDGIMATFTGASDAVGAAMAIQQGWILLLPLVGLVFVLETLSVIIQVAYFKASGGRRVFKMAPIHYTFHHEGWSERRIALSFWTAGLLGALAAFGVARLVS